MLPAEPAWNRTTIKVTLPMVLAMSGAGVLPLLDRLSIGALASDTLRVSVRIHADADVTVRIHTAVRVFLERWQYSLLLLLQE